jgi:hypothetical protein
MGKALSPKLLSCNRLGVTVPPSLLLLADEVIQ